MEWTSILKEKNDCILGKPVFSECAEKAINYLRSL